MDWLPPWRWWAAPAAVVLGLALGAIGDLMVSIVGAAAGSSVSHPGPAVNIVGSIVFDFGFVAAAIYVAWQLGAMRPVEFGFRRAPLVRVLWMLPFVAAVYFLGTAWYANALHLTGREQLPSGLGSPHDTAAMVGLGVFVCVIAPICEEFFFRGFLFGQLRSWLSGRQGGTWLAAVITGIVFGAAHTGSAAAKYLVPLGFLGFLLCILRWRTGSLYPGMALHSVNNAVAFAVDELHWGAVDVVLLAVGGLLAIAAIAGPLGWREPAVDPAEDGRGRGSPPSAAAAAAAARARSVGPPGR